MSDFLALAYPWIKAIHIMAVISWMAALFYLPRLLVHHTERVGLSGETHELFTMMEFKLANVIMRPAMIATWIFGLLSGFYARYRRLVDDLALDQGIGRDRNDRFHDWLYARVKAFATGQNTLTGRQYRMMNEVPTVLMIVIVLSVVVKF